MHNIREFFRETCIRSSRVCHYVTHRLYVSTDNAYPFLSGASRQTLGIPKDAHKFPGPGSYNIEAPRKRIPERAFSLFMPHLFMQFFRIVIHTRIFDIYRILWDSIIYRAASVLITPTLDLKRRCVRDRVRSSRSIPCRTICLKKLLGK